MIVYGIREGEGKMFYSKETRIAYINYRINLLKSRGEDLNANLIKALIREKNLIEARA